MAKKYYWRQRTKNGMRYGCTDGRSITKTQAIRRAEAHDSRVELFEAAALKSHIRKGGGRYAGDTCDVVRNEANDPTHVARPDEPFSRY